VPKLLALSQVVLAPEAYGVNLNPIANEPYFEAVEINERMDLSRVAALANIDEDELFQLNPAFKKRMTVDGPQHLLVPTAKAQLLTTACPTSSPKSWSACNRTRPCSTRPGRSQGTGGAQLPGQARRQPGRHRQGQPCRSRTCSAGTSCPATTSAGQVLALRGGSAPSAAGNRVADRQRSTQYKVRKGDSLYLVAKRFNVEMQHLKRWNPRSGQALKPGQTLTVYLRIDNAQGHCGPVGRLVSRQAAAAPAMQAAARPWGRGAFREGRSHRYHAARRLYPSKPLFFQDKLLLYPIKAQRLWIGCRLDTSPPAVTQPGLELSRSAMVSESHGYAQFGTLKYPATFTHFDWVNPQAPKGGTLRAMAFGTFDTLNPYTFKGSSPVTTPNFLQYGISELNEPLMVGTGQYDPSGDEPTSSYGLIARSVEYSEDRSWVVFNLRPEARFHDGTPITSADVAFSYRTLLKDGHPIYRTNLQEVQRVDILGPLRIRFVFKRAGNPLLILRLGEMPVLPKHYWKSATSRPPPSSHRWAAARTASPRCSPGGAGVRAGEGLLGQGPGGQPRQVQFQARRIRVLPRRDRGLRSVQGRRVRHLYRAPGEELGQRLQLPGRAPWRGDQGADPAPDPDANPGPVHEQPPRHLQRPAGTPGAGPDARLRVDQPRAVQQRLPPRHQLLPQQRVRRQRPAHRQEWLMLAPFRDQLPAKLFTEPYKVSHTDGRGISRQTLRQALGLLAEAGWKLNGQRLVDSKGQQLRMELLLVNPNLERILQPYVENLASIGIDARLRTVDRAQYKQRLDQFDFDMILMTLNQTLSPGLEQWLYFHSSQAATKGSKNYAGVKDPVVDHLLDTCSPPAPAMTRSPPPGPWTACSLAALHDSQLVPQQSPPGLPQPVRLRHHAALHPGLNSWWLKTSEKAQ
jgi:microcin C transport system substrate-binding protein